MPPAALHPQLAPEPVLLNARANGDAFPVHNIRPKTIIQQPSKTNSRLHASWPPFSSPPQASFAPDPIPNVPIKKRPNDIVRTRPAGKTGNRDSINTEAFREGA